MKNQPYFRFARAFALLAASLISNACTLIKGNSASFSATSTSESVAPTSITLAGGGGDGSPYEGDQTVAGKLALYDRAPSFSCGGAAMGFSGLAMLDPTALGSVVISPNSCALAASFSAGPSGLDLSTVSGRFVGYGGQIYEALPSGSAATGTLVEQGAHTNSAWCWGSDSSQDQVEVAIQKSAGIGAYSAVLYLGRPYNPVIDGTPPAGSSYQQWRGQTPLLPLRAQSSGSSWVFTSGTAFNLQINPGPIGGNSYHGGGSLQANLAGTNYSFPLTCEEPGPFPAAVAALHIVYVSCSQVSGYVARFALDPSDGALTYLGQTPADQLPESLTLDPASSHLYAANMGSSDISEFSIDSSTGALTPLGDVADGGGNSPKSLVVLPNGKYVYVGNRIMNSSESYFTLDAASGTLSALTGTYLNGANTYVRGLAASPSGNFLYEANWGAANVGILGVNPDGSLSPVGTVATDDGPDAIAFSPTANFAAVVAGSSNTVDIFTVTPQTGALSAMQSFAAGNGANTVNFDPSGRFVYVPNFNSNDISEYSIDSTTGALTPIGSIATGTNPNYAAVDPAGGYYFVADYGSGDLMEYSIDPIAGTLSQTAQQNICGPMGAASAVAVVVVRP